METEWDRKLQESSARAKQLDEKALMEKAEALLSELQKNVCMGNTHLESRWVTYSFLFRQTIELPNGPLKNFTGPYATNQKTTSDQVGVVLAHIRALAPSVTACAVDENNVPIDTTGPNRPVPVCIFILEWGPPRSDV